MDMNRQFHLCIYLNIIDGMSETQIHLIAIFYRNKILLKTPSQDKQYQYVV